MKSHEFVATFSLAPLKENNINLVQNRQSLISKLSSLSGMLTVFYPDKSSNIPLNIFYHSESNENGILNEKITFQAEFTPSIFFEARKLREDDPSSEDEVLTFYFSHHYLKFIFDFLIVIQLSDPGIFEFNNGTLNIDNLHSIPLPPFGTTFNTAITERKNVEWPPIESLPIPDIINLFRKDDGLLPSISSTNVERALSAFTHLFTPKCTNELLLLWSMVGIEALFTKESSGIMEQVRSKIFVLLGQNENARKLISKMYDHRSKFLHGSSNIPTNKYGTHLIDMGILKYDDDLLRTVQFSQILLVSCLQKVIKLGKNPIEFFYKIE